MLIWEDVISPALEYRQEFDYPPTNPVYLYCNNWFSIDSPVILPYPPFRNLGKNVIFQDSAILWFLPIREKPAGSCYSLITTYILAPLASSNNTLDRFLNAKMCIFLNPLARDGLNVPQ